MSSATPSISTSSSASPSSSRSSSPALALDPSTLALLDSFLCEKADAEKAFEQLAVRTRGGYAQGLGEEEREENDEARRVAVGGSGEVDAQRMIDVDEYRRIFAEQYGMSQFWYSTSFTRDFSALLSHNTTPNTRIAFICSPTGYVGLQRYHPNPRSLLLEFDDRFEVLPVVGGREAGETRGFVKYDLYEPERIPPELAGTVNFAVVDPPYLNTKTNALIATTLRSLLAPNARLLLLTSTSVPLPALREIYAMDQLGSLREVKGLEVKHEGGRFKNDYRVMASWEGGEALFEDFQSLTQQ